MQCPRCSANVNPGAKFCPNCAYDMSQPAQSAAVAPTQVMQSQSCPNCGKAVAQGMKFCPACATPMGAGTSFSSGPVSSSGQNFQAAQGYQGATQSGYPNQSGYPGAGYNAQARGSNKMPIIIGAIVLVLLIGGGLTAYFLLSGKSASGGTVETGSKEDITKARLVKIFELSKAGKNAELAPYMCNGKRDKAADYSNPTDKRQVDEIGGRLKTLLDVSQGYDFAKSDTQSKANGEEWVAWQVDFKAAGMTASSLVFEFKKLGDTYLLGDIDRGTISRTSSNVTTGGAGSPKEALEKFFRAAERGETSEVSRYVTGRLAKPETIEQITGSIRNHGGIVTFSIKNEVATSNAAQVRFLAEYQDRFSFPWSYANIVKEGDSWKVENLV